MNEGIGSVVKLMQAGRGELYDALKMIEHLTEDMNNFERGLLYNGITQSIHMSRGCFRHHLWAYRICRKYNKDKRFFMKYGSNTITEMQSYASMRGTLTNEDPFEEAIEFLKTGNTYQLKLLRLNKQVLLTTDATYMRFMLSIENKEKAKQVLAHYAGGSQSDQFVSMINAEYDRLFSNAA